MNKSAASKLVTHLSSPTTSSPPPKTSPNPTRHHGLALQHPRHHRHLRRLRPLPANPTRRGPPRRQPQRRRPRPGLPRGLRTRRRHGSAASFRAKRVAFHGTVGALLRVARAAREQFLSVQGWGRLWALLGWEGWSGSSPRGFPVGASWLTM